MWLERPTEEGKKKKMRETIKQRKGRNVAAFKKEKRKKEKKKRES